MKRRAINSLRQALGRNPAVALLGMRQVGKTTLAHELSHELDMVYLDLENKRDRDRAMDIETLYINNPDKLIVLDEVHLLPEVFGTIRGIIDQARRKGRREGVFLFLGSRSIDILKQSSESLAGRISYLHLNPIDALECEESGEKISKEQLWCRGGLPDSLLAKTDEDSFSWRLDFITTFIEQDLRNVRSGISAQVVRRFWTMLAHVHGETLNAQKLGGALEVSKVTIKNYVDLLTDMLVLRQLAPYHTNVKKRVVKSPRIYVRDSGLVHALLGLPDINAVLGHPVSGKSWEGLVIEHIAGLIKKGTELFFYRTSNGAEIDLIIAFATGEKWAIEIKRSRTPSLSKGFYIACEDIAADRRWLVYSGDDRYTLDKQVEVVPLVDFLKELLSQ